MAPGLFVDVGASIGRFSKRFADMGWAVVAFEAAPEIVQELRDTLSPYARSRVVACAVGDVDDESVEFYLSEEHWGIHSLRPFHESHQSKVEVPVKRLESELTDSDYRDPAFL